MMNIRGPRWIDYRNQKTGRSYRSLSELGFSTASLGSMDSRPQCQQKEGLMKTIKLVLLLVRRGTTSK